VESDVKKIARLNCISHLLTQIPYKEVKSPEIVLPEIPNSDGYVRPPISDQTFVPAVYGS
jgi:hypothetical protein